MPERRTNSVASFMSALHFSGKIIMASVLFGFGLLLVGTILLIIATGGQKTPPLQENAEKKKNPMMYVGPGVMGVGAFFMIVGTIMCLFETRILRRRKNTDHESLVRSEIPPMATASSPRTENQEDITNVEETQVKTVLAECHPVKSLEKTARDTSVEEKAYDRQLSSSTDREKAQAFNSSVYVDAVGENDSDENDTEEHFTSGSIQFSTPPETNASKISLDSKSGEGHDPTQIPDPTPTGALVTGKSEKGNILLLQKENENPRTVSERDDSLLLLSKDNENENLQSVSETDESLLLLPKDNENGNLQTVSERDDSLLFLPKDDENENLQTVSEKNESLLLVPKDNEITLPVSNDSIPTSVTTHTNVNETDLEKTTIHPMNVPESTEDLKKSSNTANEVSRNEESQEI